MCADLLDIIDSVPVYCEAHLVFLCYGWLLGADKIWVRDLGSAFSRDIFWLDEKHCFCSAAHSAADALTEPSELILSIGYLLLSVGAGG